ncbi:alkaline phosphatase [Pigmentiphaga sp. NML080357]|uniref:PhoX family protein n=1 Tax=Pigmentiphaga sp. NML080357 TaxID=2008675 RepID=UPI000B421FE6|nr:alkaline phosphatase PhoX [Pigmentiphaga sp. NML080357]OVZ59964.1 alkaline phosphatase [Pigmentiphaga sp. NML080357]
MSDPVQNRSRRQALKFLAGVPVMLPLGTVASTSLLAACGGDDDDPVAPPPTQEPAKFVSASFTATPAPSLANAAAMATTTVNSTLNVTLSDGSTHAYKLAYQPFFITGDMLPDGKGGRILAGGYVDINNQPIIDRSKPGQERQFFSDSPDGTSLLTLENANVSGVKGKAVFVVVQFEYNSRDQAGASTYGQLPSPIAVLTLDQDPATGKLTLVKYHNVDMSKVHGLWITCGASLSPWNTHLSSEEYEPDAFSIAGNAQFKAFSKNTYGSETAANPYNYGHLPEITVNPDGTGTAKKHFCLGRISHELIQVMPDNRTVLMGDDYTNGGLFMFVADREKDLSAGTLYVAKYTEKLTDTSTAKISWIKLGHATSKEIEDLVNVQKIQPTDIMESLTADPGDDSYTLAHLDGKPAWLKLKPGMEKAAAFLETHRYANLKGGSMAFTKMEGTTVNIKDKVAYSALANIQDSMVEGSASWLASRNVAFPKTIKAGGILQHALGGGQRDSEGGAINSEWVPTQSHLMLKGEDIAADALGNTANPENIASPDNLKFSETLRTLFIGEDSGNHVNNFLWAYNVDKKTLVRILSCPAGAESTGLHAVDEAHGWTYIMSNFQHPGDWSSLHAKVQGTLDPLIRANYKDRFGAAVGYLTADPTSVKLQG